MAINSRDEARGLDLNPMSLRETGAAAYNVPTPHGSGVTRAYAGRAVPTTRPGGLALLAGVLARGARIWMRRAADRRRLAQVDDRTLHDIGVTRAQVEYELSKPVWRA
jgi:uncharacterized protein YjiS (DUF1127 family)